MYTLPNNSMLHLCYKMYFNGKGKWGNMKLKSIVQSIGMMMGVATILAGCSQESEVLPKVEDVVQDTESEVEVKVEMIQLRPVGKATSLGMLKNYDLSPFFQHKVTMIAPEHIDDEHIIYTDSIGEVGYEIYVYDTEQATNRSLHKTSKTIGNLVGIKDDIYWSEYEATKDNGYAWSIFRMKLDASELTEIYNGVSMFETPVPHLCAADGRVTWVDYEASETMTTTSVMQFSSTSKKIETLRTYTLQEGENRDGEYVFDYRDSEGGVILHRSLFEAGEKTTRLTTIDGKFDEEMGALIDFQAGPDYVAFGKEGRAEFLGLKQEAKPFQYMGAQSKSSFDAFRFLPDNRILFREGMDRLMIADMNEGTVSYLRSQGGVTSKPLYVDGKIAYAEHGNEGEIRFYTIDVE